MVPDDVVSDGVDDWVVEEVANPVVVVYEVVEEDGMKEVARVVQTNVALLIQFHLLPLTQRLQLLRLSPLFTLMEDFLEDPLTSQCLPSMLTMRRYNYGRETYMSFMFNSNLFIIVP